MRKATLGGELATLILEPRSHSSTRTIRSPLLVETPLLKESCRICWATDDGIALVGHYPTSMDYYNYYQVLRIDLKMLVRNQNWSYRCHFAIFTYSLAKFFSGVRAVEKAAPRARQWAASVFFGRRFVRGISRFL